MTAETAASPMALETNQRPWWVTLIGGIAAMVIGAALLWGSTNTKVEVWVTLVALLGIYWLVRGILDLVSMFTDHSAWGWKLFIGVISIIAGSYILIYPVASSLALPRIFVWVLGFWALFEGIVMVAMSFKGAGLGAAAMGAISIILGLMLMANAEDFGMGLAMIWVGAIAGLVGGAFMIWHAFQQRKAGPA